MAGFTPSSRADRLPGALLLYAVALGAFLLIPPRFKDPVAAAFPTGFTIQEGLDLLTPLVVIPLAWHAMVLAGAVGRAWQLMFLVLAALWVEGQAIHLAANGIGDAFATHDAATAFYATTPGDLTLWLDEVASHWLWHVAWAGISLLLMAAAMSGPRSSGAGGVMAGMAGLFHGGTFFIVTTEGVTTALGIPLSIVLLLWALIAAGLGRPRGAIVTFLAVSASVTLLAYLGWAAVNAWTLPELCGRMFGC